MKKIKFVKKIALLLAMQILVMTIFAGCGNQVISTKEATSMVVTTIDGTDITLDQLYLYVIQYIFSNNIQVENLDEVSAKAIVDSAVDEMKLEFVEYKLALAMELTLSENAVKSIKEKADNFYQYFGKDFLSSYGVEYKCVSDMFEREAYITALLDRTVSDLTADYVKQYEEDMKDLKFHHVTYALFPSVKYGEDGKPVINADGNYVLLSDSELEEQRIKAEEVARRAKAGETLETLENEFGIVAYSGEERNYNGAYAEELNAVLENMANGDISDAVKVEAGYMVIRMNNNDDKDYKDFAISYSANQSANQAVPAFQQTWIQSSGVTNVTANTEVTGKIDVMSLCKEMNEKGYSITGGNN